ncbi:MAG TPA: hypothetical protein VGF32_12245 [Streptosporangiaceae bacterium]|jgi:hypothetical protein
MARGTWTGSGTWKTTGGGSGGLVLVVIAVVILAGSGAASAAVSALATILVIIGSIIGLTVVVGAGVLVWRARSDRPGRPISPPVVSRIGAAAPSGLSEPYKPALGAPQPLAIEPPRNELHLHFHGMDPAEVAEAIRQASDGR